MMEKYSEIWAAERTEMIKDLCPKTLALVFKTGMERILISSIY